MARKLILASIFTVCLNPMMAESPVSALLVAPADLRIENRGDGGCHLFVRAKPGLGSILLTESSLDPEGRRDSFALRAMAWNPVNGDEKRLIGGKPVGSSGAWSLVDSTPEKDGQFGMAFHLFIPWVLAWGQAGGRGGSIALGDGSFINIRAFSLPYADYSASFRDNPFILRLGTQGKETRPGSAAPRPASTSTAPAPASQGSDLANQGSATTGTAPAMASQPPSQSNRSATAPGISISAELPPPGEASLYFDAAVASFRRLASLSGGRVAYARTSAELPALLIGLLAGKPGADVVLCVDSRQGMAEALAQLRKIFDPGQTPLPSRGDGRIGLLLFRDYFEEYLYRRLDLNADPGLLSSELRDARASGCREGSGAVLEAISAAMNQSAWGIAPKLIILVAAVPPPIESPGTIDWDSIQVDVSRLGLEIDAIVLPKAAGAGSQEGS